MAEPVQITVTVDPSGGVAGFQQIGAAGDSMGAKVVTAAAAATTALNSQTQTTLKGADAVAALTAQWEKEQASIAEVNARIKEHTAAMQATAAAAAKAQTTFVKFQDWTPMVRSSTTAFMGITNELTRANVAGRVLESTFGLQNRALNQVISRSSVLGPIIAAAFPVAIFAATIPMIEKIGEGIVSLIDNMGGYTQAVKQMEQETIQASQQAFLNPKNSDQAVKNLNILNQETAANDKLKDSVDLRAQKIYAEGGFLSNVLGLTDARAAKEIFINSAIDKGLDLDKQRIDLMQKYAELVTQAGVEQAAISAEGSGLKGFAKLNFDQNVALNSNANDKSLSTQQQAEKDYDIRYEFSQKRIQLEQQETDKIISLRQQVQDETLTGENKILADETFAIGEATRLQQQNGTSYSVLQQQKVLIHQRTLNEIAAYERNEQQATLALQNETVLAGLDGDMKITQAAEQQADKQRDLYARGLIDYSTYSARIVAIDAKRNIDLANADQAAADKKQADLEKRTLEVNKLSEEQVNAQSAAALATVPPWQRAYAQIKDEENKRLLQIQTNEDALKAKYSDDASLIVQIDATAQAQRVQVWAETNDKIQAENLRLTESLGSDLQSVFDDMTSGNIGKRILANMEKLFFQIVAQWILSLGLMKSAAGSIFGSLVFGPQSTGANVFGGGGGAGGSILGSLFGGLSGSSTAPSGAAFQPGGIFSNPSLFAGGSASGPASAFASGSSVSLSALSGGSGLAGAIAGTSATSNGALVPTASSALTSMTMANAAGNAIGGDVASVATAKAGGGGLSSLFGTKGIAALAPLAAMLIGGAGGKVGQIGGLLGGLVLSGAAAPLISTLFGAIGMAGTSALIGGGIGGLLGFGIGSQHGGLLGGLSGAGSGALTGFMVGGPLGAAIGGIIGLLGGIFGGIFGSSKRKKQANALADNTIIPDITQIVTGFDGFSIDSSSAIQQLEQLRTDSQKQLSALKGQGNDVFNQKVKPAIDAAETHINGTQNERNTRSAQVFGPPQFDTGGMFSVMRGGNAGLAVLHDGEFVVTPQATKKNLSALQSLNAGGSAGGHRIDNLNIYPRTLDRAYMLSPQFQKDMLDAMNRWRQEGQF